ncbi:protein translocase subunit SecDF [Ilyomonas limi]|uniref:Multifunctional fusion protein n=1 Tax=Ilyomonas limi TaxID=2575867 RepID=A0A4U3KW19_9BACT|nr:protein translocase subunit SecDF [Ilyomonas limi]TKK66708.1 protein translocase subunit SecDF [Ilyomonas limi]
MQLKGLVRFFTIALILICLYQLSFTWIVHNHENSMSERADAWVRANFPSPEKKYAGDKAQQAIYADSLNTFKKQRLAYLLDSTKGSEIGPFGLTTYQSAKDKELNLGLDLQGGISVTMEVGLDGLIRSLANYSKDPQFNKALDNAVAIKANSGDNLINLFNQEYQKIAGSNGKLAPLFVTRSNGKIKATSSNDEVLSYLQDQANKAFHNTEQILRTRIDRFGVASPNINPDPAKGRINIELAGITDPERVRHYLQSTANLQFFEVYNIAELAEPLQSADQAMSDYLNGKNKLDTLSTLKSDTTAIGTALSADTVKHTTDTATAAIAANKPVDSTTIKKNANPILSILQPVQPQQDRDGRMQYPAFIGYIRAQDTATLGNYLRQDFIKNRFPSNVEFMYGKVDRTNTAANANILQLYAVKTLDNGLAKLEGEHVIEASQGYDERNRPSINMKMDAVGTRLWGQMTKANVGKPIAIVLDNVVYSAPFVQNEIPYGSSQITGSFTTNEAQDLASILQSGKLPAPAKIVQEQIVGPTLGKEAVNGGALAFIISFAVIFVLMLIYYNTAGWVANIALILNLLFTIGILAAFGFTITAAGIAALVLTVGMAVDTNVIIFERIKEELSRGKGYQTAVNDGYRRSYAPVLDAHVTSFLTAAILFIFGLGPVLGFATTQMVGIVLSLFCGILVSRVVTDIYTNRNRHFQYFTKFSQKIFQHAAFKFIEYRKVAYGISVIVVILGIASFRHGFDEGVEFAGGRSYTVRFENKPNVDKMRDDLKVVFGEYPIIKTVDREDQLNITTSYKIHETGNNVDSAVEQTLYKGLVPFLPQGTTYSEFASRYKQSSQTVLPTISDDLKQGATKATVIAIIMICLYIFIRFRDWRYSIGTIVSLLHDVFVTLAVFSFARSIVPFPLEIDQHFIAAILTVIGFSMNDTVIVYDRIREDSKLMRGESKEAIINRAINQTLSRTIMTSLTVFLTLLILFIFGGEVTRGFAFAMLIGVITGTYSSIFVAAPILVDFARNKPLGPSTAPEIKVKKTVA